MTPRRARTLLLAAPALVAAVGAYATRSAHAGEIAAWGFDEQGQVSAAPTGSDFVAVAGAGNLGLALDRDGVITAWGSEFSGSVSAAPTGGGYTAIAAGYVNGYALAADGSVVAWGWDVAGQVSGAPSGTGYTAIDAYHQNGGATGYALAADGSIVAWGYDGGGQVSNVPAGTGYTAVAGGLDFALALTADGAIVGWGSDAFGEISGIPAGTGFRAIDAGQYLGLAVAADGSVVAWGTDQSGNIDDAPEGTGFVEVSATYRTAGALRADGSLVVWGYDNYGQVSGAPAGRGFSELSVGLLGFALRSMFVPGDRLQGELGVIGATTAAAFEGLEGEKLKLTFPKADGAFKSRVTVRDDQGEVVKEWTVNHKKKSKKAAKLLRSGQHTISIEAISGTPGPFEVVTSRGLPSAAKSSKQTRKGKGESKEASFTLLAIEGATVAATFVPKNGFAGPMSLAVTKPDGASFAVTTQDLSSGGIAVDPFPAPEAGAYVFTISGFVGKKEKVTGKLELQQPPPGAGTVVLP